MGNIRKEVPSFPWEKLRAVYTQMQSLGNVCLVKPLPVKIQGSEHRGSSHSLRRGEVSLWSHRCGFIL